MRLKFQAATPPKHEYVNRLSLDSTRAHAETSGFLDLMSWVVMRFSRSLAKAATSATDRTVLLAILAVYFRNIPVRAVGQKTPRSALAPEPPPLYDTELHVHMQVNIARLCGPAGPLMLETNHNQGLHRRCRESIPNPAGKAIVRDPAYLAQMRAR